MSLKKLAEAVRKQNNFLITTHVNPEGDALGSELGLYLLLRRLGKRAVIVNEDGVPNGYEFLPAKENIRPFGKNAKWVKFDCMVVLDCSDLDRTGEVWRLNKLRKPVINIDHHVSNRNFGDVNCVDPRASSASEIVFNLYKEMRLPLDRDSAVCLYTGIFTDTGSFRYSNTSPATHRVAAELLNQGISVPQIYKNVYENVPFQDMKLLADILPNMKRQARGRLVWFQIRHNMLKGKKLSFDLSEHVLSFGRTIKGAEVVVLFKENLGVKDEIRINLRSNGAVDVNKIAACFGGGGHKTASGATVNGKIDAVRRKVLAKIRESLE